jgi:hypothetical protein
MQTDTSELLALHTTDLSADAMHIVLILNLKHNLHNRRYFSLHACMHACMHGITIGSLEHFKSTQLNPASNIYILITDPEEL